MTVVPTRLRGVRWAAAVAAAGLLLAACSGSGSSGAPASSTAADVTAAAESTASVDPASITGSITVMHDAAEINDETIAKFNEIYPNIEVTTILDDPVKLKALQAAGTPPDIFRAEGPAIPSLVTQGQVMDLTERFAADGLDPATLFDAADLYVIDGKRYGVPKDWSPDFTVFINNKAFEEAGIPIPDPATPLSWADLAKLAGQLTKSTGGQTQQIGIVGAFSDFSPARTVSTMLAESGQKLYSDDGTTMQLTSNPDAMEALRFIADMQKDGVTWTPTNPSPSWGGDDFAQGKAAMAVYGFWYSGLLAGIEDSAIGTDYTMIPGPYWKDSTRRINPTITGTGYLMSSKTANPDAAWAFLNWYSLGDQAAERAAIGFGLPISKSNTNLLPHSTATQEQVLGVTLKETEISPAIQFSPYYNDSVFSDSFNRYVQEYVAGSLAFEDMAASIEADVNAALQDGVDQAG